MSDEQFLTIPSIPGEVRDDRHPGAIDVVSWSWAVANTSADGPGGGGGRVGRANLTDIVVSLRFDAAAPRLFEACARGTRLSEVLLTARRAGMRGDYLSLRLKDAVLTAVNTAATADGSVLDITLGFASVTLTYQSQLPDGSLGDPVSVTLGRER